MNLLQEGIRWPKLQFLGHVGSEAAPGWCQGSFPAIQNADLRSEQKIPSLASSTQSISFILGASSGYQQGKRLAGVLDAGAGEGITSFIGLVSLLKSSKGTIIVFLVTLSMPLGPEMFFPSLCLTA